MDTKRIIGIIVSFVMLFGVFSTPIQAGLPQRTTVEYEKNVDGFIQTNVDPGHAMGIDYKGVTKSEINEFEEIVDFLTKDCSTARDKAFAIYNWIETTIDYNYGCEGYLHCAQRDCPINDIENSSGTSVLMAYHVYKSGLGVCEDYANLASVLMKMADIPTILIADMDGNHAFNAFYDGNRWVYFDSTWANQYNPEKHFDMTVEFMHSIGSHRLHSLQALDKDGVLYDVWFSEERYCYISGSISGYETLIVSPGLYGIKFVEDTPASPIHPDVEKLIIEEGVTEIPDNFFKGCVNLSNITFPDTLDRIGSYAFEKCTSLKEFTVPDSVTTLGTAIIEYSGVEYLKIGSSVSNCPGTSFINTEKLKKVVISEGVKEICYGMFMYCDAIEEIHIPSTLKKIRSTAFYGMDPIEKIYYNGTKEDWRKVEGDILNPGIPTRNIIFLKEPEIPEEEENAPDNKEDAEENTEEKPQESVKPSENEPDDKPVTPAVKPQPKPEEEKGDEGKKEQKENEKELGKTLKNLKKRFNYKGNFKDVKNTAWYADYVKTAYEMGIINGSSDTSFSPDSTLTIYAVVKMASVINYYYNGGKDENYFAAKKGQKWYEPYVDYAKDTFLGDYRIGDGNMPAERMFVAYVFYNCLPSSEYPSIRYVENIPDVNKSSKYYKSISALYEAGVLTGNDSKGTFTPRSHIKRSETAAIMARVIDSSLRSREDLGKKPESAITGAVWYVPETTEADRSLYDESDWIKITKIEYEEPMGDYTHEITSLKCYDRKENKSIRGDYVAIRCEIEIEPEIPANARVYAGGVVILEDGTRSYDYIYTIKVRDGYFELNLPADMKKGDYEYDNSISIDNGATNAKIYFTVK